MQLAFSSFLKAAICSSLLLLLVGCSDGRYNKVVTITNNVTGVVVEKIAVPNQSTYVVKLKTGDSIAIGIAPTYQNSGSSNVELLATITDTHGNYVGVTRRMVSVPGYNYSYASVCNLDLPPGENWVIENFSMPKNPDTAASRGGDLQGLWR